jgi:hypothetical protein
VVGDPTGDRGADRCGSQKRDRAEGEQPTAHVGRAILLRNRVQGGDEGSTSGTQRQAD